MDIDRCYCYEESFEKLKAVAADTDATSLQDLQKHVTFGENCELCHPYVRRMLATGQTVFHEVLDDEEDASSS